MPGKSKSLDKVQEWCIANGDEIIAPLGRAIDGFYAVAYTCASAFQGGQEVNLELSVADRDLNAVRLPFGVFADAIAIEILASFDTVSLQCMQYASNHDLDTDAMKDALLDDFVGLVDDLASKVDDHTGPLTQAQSSEALYEAIAASMVAIRKAFYGAKDLADAWREDVIRGRGPEGYTERKRIPKAEASTGQGREEGFTGREEKGNSASA